MLVLHRDKCHVPAPLANSKKSLKCPSVFTENGGAVQAALSTAGDSRLIESSDACTVQRMKRGLFERGAEKRRTHDPRNNSRVAQFHFALHDEWNSVEERDCRMNRAVHGNGK